jgi:catechol 2,3-dioxygenase-like lactoylglutathione lyase family enzyme
MSNDIEGLHHVTAICGDPQPNYDFYVGTLGLRLVKKTVNFDDPGSYHLYYADGAGTPGSVLTFFPWPDLPSGRDGTGQAGAVAFATDEAGLDYWEKRLTERGVELRGPLERFGEPYIEFADPDGMRVEIVATAARETLSSPGRLKRASRYATQGFHSVTLLEAGYELTQALLVHQMGWTWKRNSAGASATGPRRRAASQVDVLCQPGGRHGLPGTGTVHHVAFRVADEAAQREWREKLLRLGHKLSPVIDRNYFHSIYYREPGASCSR